MSDLLQLTLFGTPEVRINSQPVTGFRSSKAQALLYYLAVTGRPHTRPALAGLFWGDQPETAARASLSKCLSNLHDLVGDAVLVDRQTVAFNRHYAYSLDTEQFEQEIKIAPTPATVQSLQTALARYRGDVLEGFYVRDAPDFEQWVLTQRAYFREAVINALHSLANWHDLQADLPQAITHTRRLLTLEPWREEAHRQLMLRLARSGQRAAALAQFETCRRVLDEELAVEPDVETVALVETIRTGSFDKGKKVVELAIQNPQSAIQNSIDWGEAPDVSQFQGRHAELSQLRKWLVDDQCRLVAVLGMGGQGKTALATMAATQVESEFACIIWRSLRNAPPLEELLRQLLQSASPWQTYELPVGIEQGINLLLAHLQSQRCLLVLDNFETVLHSERVGTYRPGYEGYGQLLQRVGEGRHQSCLLLTSREKPRELVTLTGATAPVRILSLTSLSSADCQALLQDRLLMGSDADWIALHARYSGNPLALKIVSETIRELFLGQIHDFLRTVTILFSDIDDLLTKQFARLSPLEQEVMLWLAIEREPIDADELRADLVYPIAKVTILAALQGLRHRSLVERTATGFTVQNVVLEYVTDYLVKHVSHELTSGSFLLCQRHALLKAQSKTYVQESQRTLILAPIAHQLIEQVGKLGVVERLRTFLSELRHGQPHQSGYIGGNLLNLLVHIHGDLRGWDFSQLVLWQADLRSINAEEVDFSQADLTNSAFTETFAGVCAVAFSPDGKHLAAGTMGNELHIWRVNDSQPLLTCVGHTGWVNSICFSPDGTRLFSGSADGKSCLWDVRTGQCLAVFEGHTAGITAISISPNGVMLASGSRDHTVQLWDVRSRHCLTTLLGHGDQVRAVCFSPHGLLLASGSSDRTIRLWEIVTGQCVAILQGHNHRINAICFSPDGTRLASGSDDQMIRLWDVQGGQCIAVLPGQTDGVSSLCFNPDGNLLASGSWDPTVRLWDIHSGQCLAVLRGHLGGVFAVDFSPDGNRLVSGSRDRTVRLWDVPSKQCIATLQGHSTWVNAVCFSPDGNRLASSNTDAVIHLWEVNRQHCLTTLRGHQSWVNSVCFNSDGNVLVSASDDRTIRLWEVHSGQCIAILHDTNDLNTVCFSPDSNLLASGSLDPIVRLWDTRSGQCAAILQGHTAPVYSVCFSADGRWLASGSWDGTVRLWDVHRRKCYATLQGHTDWVYTVCFHPNCALVASGSLDQTIRLWDIDEGQCLATLAGHTDKVTTVSFSPAGNLLASGSLDQTIRLWDVQGRRCCAILQGHTNEISSVAFHPDGRTLASGGNDGAIQLWDVQTGKQRFTLRGSRPYERMNITGTTGLTYAQVATLKALGAVDNVV